MIRTVLVVDDNSAIRTELREMLRSRGFDVREASNGREAIDLAREYLPSLIILDLSMPIMSGIEAAPELRAIVPGAAIILFSLFADTVSPADLKTHGIDAALSKHEPIEVVIETAEALCGGPSAGTQQATAG